MSSAGICHGCGKHAKKRYGGMGRWFAYCLSCWSTDGPERDIARARFLRHKGSGSCRRANPRTSGGAA